MQIYIGWDKFQAEAWDIAVASLRQSSTEPVVVKPLNYIGLKAFGLYTRPTKAKGFQLYDTISVTKDYDGAMSTGHAIARFFIPHLVSEGWALFTDGDVLFRGDVNELLKIADPKYALYCVQHDYRPIEKYKMVGQTQSRYHRKNWSSVMLFNCSHPANKRLTLKLLNSVPGRDLHRFCWLEDNEIGELSPAWNYLVGHTQYAGEPMIVHFTEGLPNMPVYENCEFADEWRSYGKVPGQVGYQ